MGFADVGERELIGRDIGRGGVRGGGVGGRGGRVVAASGEGERRGAGEEEKLSTGGFHGGV
jgi:hypothetical protein